MSAVCGPHRPFPTFMRAGGSPARLVQPAQPALSSGGRSPRRDRGRSRGTLGRSPTAVALLDRGLQGAPAGEGLGAALALGFGAALPWASRARLPRSCCPRRAPADGRAHRGDVAQQEVEVVAAPVVKDHWDGLGRLGRDVAGVAQRAEILPGAVAVVELLLGGLKGREALPAVSGGPVLQLLPPGHADGPSSASPGEVVVSSSGGAQPQRPTAT